MGVNISALGLAAGCPSIRTLANWEYNIGVECLAITCLELRQDNAQFMYMITDHGKRNGIKHFIKIITWAGYNKNGNRKLKDSCLDIDKSGHTSRGGAADAIQKAVKKITSINDDLENNGITGDSGSGAAVQ